MKRRTALVLFDFDAAVRSGNSETGIWGGGRGAFRGMVRREGRGVVIGAEVWLEEATVFEDAIQDCGQWRAMAIRFADGNQHAFLMTPK